MSVGNTPLGPLPARTNPRHSSGRRSVFARLSVQAPVKHRKMSVSRDLPFASVNMTERGQELRRDRQASHSTPDPDYSPGLGEVLVHEGVFRNTRSRVAIPYSYEQPSSSTALASPEPRRALQLSDEEDEDSGYASSGQSAQCEQTEHQSIWLIMLTTTFCFVGEKFA